MCERLTGSGGLAPSDNGVRLDCYRCQNENGLSRVHHIMATLLSRVSICCSGCIRESRTLCSDCRGFFITIFGAKGEMFYSCRRIKQKAESFSSKAEAVSP